MVAASRFGISGSAESCTKFPARDCQTHFSVLAAPAAIAGPLLGEMFEAGTLDCHYINPYLKLNVQPRTDVTPHNVSEACPCISLSFRPTTGANGPMGSCGSSLDRGFGPFLGTYCYDCTFGAGSIADSLCFRSCAASLKRLNSETWSCRKSRDP